MNSEQKRIEHKAERILHHLEVATSALDGKGGSIEEMAASVRTARELMLDLKSFLTPIEEDSAR